MVDLTTKEINKRYGNNRKDPATGENAQGEALKKKTLPVNGMSCASGAARASGSPAYRPGRRLPAD